MMLFSTHALLASSILPSTYLSPLPDELHGHFTTTLRWAPHTSSTSPVLLHLKASPHVLPSMPRRSSASTFVVWQRSEIVLTNCSSLSTGRIISSTPLSNSSALIRLSHPQGFTPSIGNSARSFFSTNSTSAIRFLNGAADFSANLMSSTRTQSPSAAHKAGRKPKFILSS